MNINKIAQGLLIVGGLNWLLEAFHTGLTQWLPWNIAMVIYILVGISALYKLFGNRSH
ncbi:MAG: DUF378 domain-containing protein [Minisyncoccia bacterium]